MATEFSAPGGTVASLIVCLVLLISCWLMFYSWATDSKVRTVELLSAIVRILELSLSFA